jgi:protein SCO1/2
MNKTAWWGLSVALFLPLICYFIVKFVGEDAVVMPRRYFADSVIEKSKDGKTSYDTVWHNIPDFVFTDQLGRRITPSAADGKIWVVNTFFTHCPNICPALTRNMRKLQASFENPKRKKFGDTSVVYFMSFSVDPQRDSVEALKKWATRFFVNSDNWSLLTGPKKDIYGLLFNDFKLSAKDGEGIDTNFIHTEKVMLVDRDRVVRGFYNGIDCVDMGLLAEDIGKLYLERDRRKPSLFREYIPLVPVLIAVPIIVFLGMWFLNRKKEY